jgi:ribosome-binding factor A
MANPRTKARIEARIRERVAHCVEFELNDPRAAFITISRVEISADLSISKIYYTVMGSEGDKRRVARMLEDATGFVRRQVGRVLRTRRVPRLTWFYDDSIEFAENMNNTIAQAIARDREINPDAHLHETPEIPEAPGASEASEDGEETEGSEEGKERAPGTGYAEYLRAREKKRLNEEPE